MTMPFGKYRGWRLADLPSDYVVWLLGLELREPLRSAVEAERRRRDRPRPDPRLVKDLISVGQRQLARRHHPDVGGSHEAMLAVRYAAEWLFAQADTLLELHP